MKVKELIEHLQKYDLEQERIIEKYGHNMKQYELEFELIDSGYMFLGQKELN